MRTFVTRVQGCLLLSCLLGSHSLVLAQTYDFNGQVRGLVNSNVSNSANPLGLASQLAPGLGSSSGSSAVMETELHASGKGINAVATLQGQLIDGGQTQATAWVNELYGNLGDGAWQLSVGKKTISWDVGYGFRPNDFIAQEKRRSLISYTVIGKPLANLEYFNGNSSLSLVWVNPGHSATTDVSEEQAFAARLYHHIGSVDLHGFMRYGQENGGSLGGAASWVATDEIEAHASLRFLRKSTGLRMNPDATLIQHASPWQNSTQSNVVQAMLGANYTTESQHSFFLEAWWDGTALSDREWRNWNTRNQSLRSSISMLPQLQQVLGYNLGYNLAWQNQALSGSDNIRRKNVFVRWSWQENGWQPSLDMQWTPEDKGRVMTAALSWQGNRINISGGLRFYGGPSQSIFAQLPDSRVTYVSATWAF